MTRSSRFEDWEVEQERDPEFRAIAEEMEPAYQLARLRILYCFCQAKTGSPAVCVIAGCG